MWKGEDTVSKDYKDSMIYIEAKVKHQFLALEDSVIYCIHNADHALIAEENRLEFV